MKRHYFLRFLTVLTVASLTFANLLIVPPRVKAANLKDEKNLEVALLNQIKKSTASDGLATDQLGWSVAISGDTVVVGANSANVGINQNQGAAYIFERHAGGTNNWGQVKKIVASDGGDFENFGTSVAISGDLIVVGAPFAQIGINIDQGAAYIFERNAGGTNNWGQIKKLTGGFDPGDQFGFSVTIFGDTAFVGCRADTITATGQGSVSIFERNLGGGNNWGLSKLLLASDAEANDLFGSAVSTSNDLLIVGAPFDTINGLLYQGSAYIFERNTGGANNWGQVKKLLYADPNALVLDYFGTSVSISGDTAIVGIPRASVGNVFVQGAAFVFQQNAGGANNWGTVKKLTTSDAVTEDFLGNSVSISGDKAIVGGSLKNIGTNTDQGAAYIFERNAGGANNWGETQKITSSDGASFDQFGKFVAISGNTVVSGSPGSNIGAINDQGAVYFFENLTPTAATATINGRAADSNGQGIPRVRISLTDSNGNIRYAVTNSFGYYRFEELEIGQTYVLQAASKRFQFQNNPRILLISEDLADEDFTAF
jgi:hypothetical protein